MSRNEAQTRFELIDPALINECGWARADIRIEETAAPVDVIYKKGKRRPKGRSDYVLRHPLQPGAEPIPLAILEAKAENLPPHHGLQQGKGYLMGHLHKVPFVFSSNGHQFIEFDVESGITSDPRPMSQFPRPEDLVARYLSRLSLQTTTPALQLLTTGYAQGRDYLRYYQDAAIRAAFEKIIVVQQQGKPPRVLLSLATGSGKTRIAAALLRRMFDAGMLGRALVLCDRTELRDNSLGDFQAAFGTDAAEVDTRNPQKNARVLIATYQTLDKSQGDGKDANFFLKHYPPDYFDVIVIDECHRSAWGDWHLILTQNSKAVQIGLTATPRQIKLPESKDAVTRQGIEEDRRRLADNHQYFGDPVYEYTYLQGVEDGYLAPCDIEQYDLFHDGHLDPERIRGVLRGDVKNKKLTNALTGQPVTPDSVSERTEGSALEQKLILPERVTAMCQHLFDRILDTGDKDPLQKTIIFCASDHHADLVANELNNLYAKWCAAHRQKRVDTYAFKCMSSVSGQDLIPDFRNRQRSHIVATTKDLLSTGVNVPCVRNIVFFRYLQSPILFHQMVGRGTRIDEETGKLIFHIFDYTGATALFGTDFITKPPPEPPADPKPPGPPPPPPVKVKGIAISIQDTGRFNLMNVDGKLTRVTPAQYQQHLVDQLTALIPSFADFRARWLDAEKRRQLMHDLAQQGLWPDRLRDAAKMDDYDLFDVVAALAYPIALSNLILHGIDEPHVWHGNSLSGNKTYDGLFVGAPQFFDCVLMNPPFGGKEGKDAQIPYDYKTNATQILFLQNVLKSMKAGSKCGIVLDEGVLFRTNEEAFVKTKEKLLEECDVHCIVSLPGGVFTSAGAGVKTNLVFFTKGRQTEKIWYYDLSDIKTGKKTPFTQAHFDDFFKLLPTRPESERSWTIDFTARQEKARAEAQPFHEKSTQLNAEAKVLEDQIVAKKKNKSLSKEELDTLELNWKTVLKSARESLSKATDIENAVYDLKAVNPNRKVITDTRTPAELLDFIESKGREADEALSRLRSLIATSNDFRV